MKAALVVVSLAFVLGVSVGGALAGGSQNRLSANDAAKPLITGIGGVFFKAREPAALREW